MATTGCRGTWTASLPSGAGQLCSGTKGWLTAACGRALLAHIAQRGIVCSQGGILFRVSAAELYIEAA